MATPSTFRNGLFIRLGIKSTPATVSALYAWELAEGPLGGQAWLANNPLNTTKGMPGGMFDRPGTFVPGYKTEKIGIEATARTLEQSNMAGILGAFRRGAPYAEIRAAIVASPWAAGHYNQGRSFPGAVKVEVTEQKTYPGILDVPGVLGPAGLLLKAKGGDIRDAIKGPLEFMKFIGWLLQPSHWLRVGEVILGVVVVVGGVALIAKDVFGAQVPMPAPARKAATVAAEVAGPALEAA